MDESDTLGIGESDDINLPLDEIIQRKAQRERGTAQRQYRRGTPRRYGFHSRHNFGRRSDQDIHSLQPSYGTGAFHRDMQMADAWPQYEEEMTFGSQPTQMDVDPGQYWQMYGQPPPPPKAEVQYRDFRTQPPRVPVRGGIRKPVLDRRRGAGGRRRRPHPLGPSELPLHIEKPKMKEDKCTMTFEQGHAVIRFNDVDILKVNPEGDLVLTTEGHQDDRFLKALNGVLGLINVEILADASKPDSWKVKDAYALFRYYDGIAIKGKGEPTKTRAETLRKAFEQPNPKALEATLASNLAARRLGLAFDPMSNAVGPGGHPVPPGSSIRITQDQQLTRTSKYSISFVDQNKQHEQDSSHQASAHPQKDGHPSMHPGTMYHPY